MARDNHSFTKSLSLERNPHGKIERCPCAA
jgi:hypothetical protein